MWSQDGGLVHFRPFVAFSASQRPSGQLTVSLIRARIESQYYDAGVSRIGVDVTEKAVP
jgi:hypothetical protein